MVTPEMLGEGGVFSVTGVGWPEVIAGWLCARTPGS